MPRVLGDLQYATPNLQVSESGDVWPVVRIRGISSNTRVASMPGRTGVYIDGALAGRSQATDQDLFDLERVEILHGPQVTLFGRNTVTGAISLTTRKPWDELGGWVRANIGNRDAMELAAVVNVPLSQNFYAKFSANRVEADGYMENLYLERDVNGRFAGLSRRIQLPG